ncbi:unnamed protein product [Paramecium primaurelia]|uniref:Uncharacterized protein n=1 Tax=Paramecium primaurelia TaxID=5886 RepID=A0A8S1MMC5_PARPR|nr:unnamed protein product [Paramecium primaurelia]
MSNANTMSCLWKESKDAKPYVNRVPIPTVEEGQLLIRMDYAPINPSDIKFLQGQSSSNKQFPCVPGFEGSGTVVLTGGGMASWGMSGKRVAFYTNHEYGTYGEYCITDTNLCIELDNDMESSEAACSFVNPLSVIGMLDICKKNNAKAVINNPGASQLGKMMNRLFKERNIKVINIVRREEQVYELRYECGAELIINQNDPDFLKQLKIMCEATQASIYFDAVGGEQSGQILNIMPKGSILMMYGTLESWQIGGIQANNLLQEKKSIQGFFLNIWLKEQNKLELMVTLKKLKNFIKTSLKTKIAKEFSLDQFQQAIDYYKSHMTDGKTLIFIK